MKIPLALHDRTFSEADTDMMTTQIITKDSVVCLLYIVEPFPK